MDSLPREILSLIASVLGPVDQARFRRTSRLLNQACGRCPPIHPCLQLDRTLVTLLVARWGWPLAHIILDQVMEADLSAHMMGMREGHLLVASVIHSPPTNTWFAPLLWRLQRAVGGSAVPRYTIDVWTDWNELIHEWSQLLRVCGQGVRWCIFPIAVRSYLRLFPTVTCRHSFHYTYPAVLMNLDAEQAPGRLVNRRIFWCEKHCGPGGILYDYDPTSPLILWVRMAQTDGRWRCRLSTSLKEATS